MKEFNIDRYWIRYFPLKDEKIIFQVSKTGGIIKQEYNGLVTILIQLPEAQSMKKETDIQKTKET